MTFSVISYSISDIQSGHSALYTKVVVNQQLASVKGRELPPTRERSSGLYYIFISRLVTVVSSTSFDHVVSSRGRCGQPMQQRSASKITVRQKFDHRVLQVVG